MRTALRTPSGLPSPGRGARTRAPPTAAVPAAPDGLRRRRKEPDGGALRNPVAAAPAARPAYRGGPAVCRRHPPDPRRPGPKPRPGAAGSPDPGPAASLSPQARRRTVRPCRPRLCARKAAASPARGAAEAVLPARRSLCRGPAAGSCASANRTASAAGSARRGRAHRSYALRPNRRRSALSLRPSRSG